jgi:hypothetical protein
MKPDVPSDAELFRAARLERAPESLRMALLASQTSSTPRHPIRPSSERKRASRSWAAGVCAAAAAGFVVWWSSMPVDDEPRISAEQRPPAATGSLSREPATDPALEMEADKVRAHGTIALPPKGSSPASTPVSAGQASARGAPPRPPARASRATQSSPARSAASPPAAAQESVAAPPPRSATSGQPTPPAESSTRATFAEQLDILKRARSALRAADGRGALALLERHDDALRGGGLEAEARLLRIEALAASQRSPEARDLARQFILDYPNSPLAARARGFAERRPPRTP